MKLTKDEFIALFKDGWVGILLTVILGIVSWKVTAWANSPYLDSLLVALIAGMILRTLVGVKRQLIPGFVLAPLIFVPIGAIFYAAVNLDFVKFSKINPKTLILMVLVIAAYFVAMLLLNKVLKINNKTNYLATTGSAICGASAICMTSPAVDAEPDDVSQSLIAVLIAGIIAILVMPAIAKMIGMDNRVYALFTGTILQFTGFVKAASATLPKDMAALALSIKAARYLVLILAIPMFSSMVTGKFTIPKYLWGYLIAGLLVSYVPAATKFVASNKAILNNTLTILWSIAMATIGMNANIKSIFSANGLKAIALSVFGLAAALLTFVVGSSIINV